MLAQLLQEHQAAIVAGCRADGGHRTPADAGHLDELVALLARVSGQGDAARVRAAQGRLEEVAGTHALRRRAQGLQLEEVVGELGALRAEVWARLPTLPVGLRDERAMRAFDGAVDAAILAAVSRLVSERTEVLAALGGAAHDHAEAPNLEALLHAFCDASEAVHSAGVLLRRGERLQPYAAIGLANAGHAALGRPMGEGFAGTVGATNAPLLVHDAARDPLVASEAIRAQGIHALYGVPLVLDGHVAGVAHMGSRTAHDFGREDRELFGILVARVAGILGAERLQGQLDAERARIAATQAQISERARLSEELQRAVQAREDILAVVSHDLRTPVSAIRLRGHNMERRARRDPKRVDERLVADAAFLEAATGRVDRLIDDLMDFASLQAGRLSISTATAVVGELLADAYALFEQQAERKRLRLVQKPQDGADALAVQCDRDRVAQIFTHLVGNAVKVTGAGGGITLGAAPHADGVIFWVQDTGPGIDAADLPHLFERYWRAGDAQYKGTGLGLSIADGLVQAQGGRIWAESERGAGARFCFTLPQA